MSSLKVAQLEAIQSEIDALNLEITKAKLQAKQLLEQIDKYQLIDRLKEILDRFPEQKKAFEMVIKKVKPKFNDDNKFYVE